MCRVGSFRATPLGPQLLGRAFHQEPVEKEFRLKKWVSEGNVISTSIFKTFSNRNPCPFSHELVYH